MSERSRLKLTVVAGPDTAASLTFDGDRLVIGRGGTSDLVLADSAVSRQHAAIEREGDLFVLVDLGSNNGTFLEGESSRITRRPLASGDQIALGRTRIRLEISPPLVARPPVRETDATVPAGAPAAKPEAAKPPSPVTTGAPPTPPRVGAQLPSDLPIVLTVVSGPDRGMVYSPTSEVIRIGRLPSSDVPLSDPGVSRLHATIKRERSGYFVYDENSRNGTQLGAPPQAVFHAELKNGDVLRLGETEIRIEIGAGKGEASAIADKTVMFGTVGDKTFAMSLKGLSGRTLVRPMTRSDDATLVVAGPTVTPPAAEKAAAPPRIVLRVTSGVDHGKAIEPPPGTARFTVGRGDKADFVLRDPGVSSTHFSIVEAGGDFVLKDEGSKNGTYLNRKPERVTTAVLKGGEAIRVGASELKVEIAGAAPSAAAPGPARSTIVVPGPLSPPPSASEARAPVVAVGAERERPEEALPELARSAAAKERIGKIMKGTSLRPVRVPGTARQWASLAFVLLAVAASYAFPRTWIAAGPVNQGHADIEQKCETCHARGAHLLSIAGPGSSATAMDATCASASCHGKVLHDKAGVRDDCVSCHTEHRGRVFPIRGGPDLCWSCHRGRSSPQDFDTRLMKIAVTTEPSLRMQLTTEVRLTEIGLKFSHPAHDKQTHGDVRYDTCVGCHTLIENGRTFAWLPGHAQCIDCHASAVSADVKAAQQKAGPACLECHLAEDGRMKLPPPRKFEYVAFTHRDHQRELCKSCHAPIWNEGPYRSVPRTGQLYPLAMDQCYTCHQDKHATVACLDCHREHHSFPTAGETVSAVSGGGFHNALLVLLALVLGAFGYVYADVRVARRALAPPPPPALPGAGGDKPAAEGEIMPFPKVDVEACISCSSCYNSCPKQVLAGDDHGKSTVVNPGSCVALEGCAVCEQGCPTGAIRVSTAPLKRTVERPEIDEHNEAKIPGLFFAGEVIGAALIKSAINQGNDCVKYIAEKKPKVADVPYDVVIVGAGPAGLGAALEAKRRGLRYLVLERDTVASTIKNYPRDKAVLAEPIKMPLYGQLPMMDADKQTLMEVWKTIVRTTGLQVKEFEEVTDVRRKESVLEVVSARGTYLTANAVLAIGTRGNPRKLGCPGECAELVQYNLIDAAEWRGKSILVVGGGDSAIEAAVALGKVEGAKVVLSYRKGEFARVKKRNQEQIEEAAKSGRVELVFNSSVKEIAGGKVVLKTSGGDRELSCHQVFALIGADPPKAWIEKLGVPFVMREEEVVTW